MLRGRILANSKECPDGFFCCQFVESILVRLEESDRRPQTTPILCPQLHRGALTRVPPRWFFCWGSEKSSALCRAFFAKATRGLPDRRLVNMQGSHRRGADFYQNRHQGLTLAVFGGAASARTYSLTASPSELM